MKKIETLREAALKEYMSPFGGETSASSIDSQSAFEAGWDAALKALAELAPEFDEQNFQCLVKDQQMSLVTENHCRFAARWQYECNKATIDALKVQLEKLEYDYRLTDLDAFSFERQLLDSQAMVDYLRVSNEKLNIEIERQKEIIADSIAGRNQWRKTQRENTELRAQLAEAALIKSEGEK